MTGFFIYLLKSTLYISICYLFYRVFMRNDPNFKIIRLFLISSMIISLLLPLSNYSIDTGISIPSSSGLNIENNVGDQAVPSFNYIPGIGMDMSAVTQNNEQTVPWTIIIPIIYGIVAIYFLARMIKQLLVVLVCYFRSTKVKRDGFTYIYNNSISNTFSFFRWIFISGQHNYEEDQDEIIIHEKIHGIQYHSADLILVQLMMAVMWFNPVVWMLRNSLQLIHEYIADEETIRICRDRLRYQALVVNQVAEGRLISLSSSFNQSLIKKRIIMMTKEKIYQNTKLKILAFIPVIAIIFLVIACMNGKKQDTTEDIVTAIAPVKMNVFYLGVDNPVNILVSGYDADEIRVEIDNGNITGSNGEYIARPTRTGTAVITLYAGDKKVKESEFRVQFIDDPVTRIGESEGGNITKQELQLAGGVNAYIRDFDFDLEFKVVSFVVSATIPNSNVVREEISDSDRFSDLQIDLINSLVKNQKLMVEQVKAVGPDGSIRNLNSLVFTIW
ncbi:MAG: hypothetical protein AMS27_15355 [Bacteroides sp. SM23_62_1]|nr:MAG: hypothetical protein AMS27_15355 [Bacteroides sp. SM23_62_1]